MKQPTSRAAYQEAKPTLSERQTAVLAVLTEPMTNTEIAHALPWPINTMTPRIFELRIKRKVEWHDNRPCRVTGKRAIAWRKVAQTS